MKYKKNIGRIHHVSFVLGVFLGLLSLVFFIKKTSLAPIAFYASLACFWLVLRSKNLLCEAANSLVFAKDVSQTPMLIQHVLAMFRGLLSIFASILALLGIVKGVMVLGTIAIIIVYTEFVLENKKLEKRLKNKSFVKKIEKNKKLVKFKRCAQMMVVIIVLGLLFNWKYMGGQYLLAPGIFGLALSYLYFLRCKHGFLQQEMFHDLNEERITTLKKTIKASATARGFLGTAATVLAYFPVFPVYVLRVIGSILLAINFLESFVENFSEKQYRKCLECKNL